MVDWGSGGHNGQDYRPVRQRGPTAVNRKTKPGVSIPLRANRLVSWMQVAPLGTKAPLKRTWSPDLRSARSR